jgi:transcription antitermination factor NusA-like protein
MEEDRMPKKIFTQELEGLETKRKTQERMERRRGKRSSSVGSEKMERVGDKIGKNGEVFDRPKSTAGFSANGRRRRYSSTHS